MSNKQCGPDIVKYFVVEPSNVVSVSGTTGDFYVCSGTTFVNTISGCTGYVNLNNTIFNNDGSVLFNSITTTPPSSPNTFMLYGSEITTGNLAPHFMTENGSIVRLYQETTGVTSSTLVSNGGNNITDADTFGGYTIQQIVQVLKNLGILA
jgi:hypothetical protein